MKKDYKIRLDGRGLSEYELCAKILDNRGIKDVEHFLNPVVEDLIHLNQLKNIHKAYEIYMDTINNGGSISILADCDTDGVCSGTIITRYTREKMNYECSCFINNGKAHGLKGQDLERFRDSDLVIIVDSLDETTEYYDKLKCEYEVKNIIVLDHHDIKINYDNSVILVSSQNDYNNPNLSGAGVVWKFICYCEEQENLDWENAIDYADLAAIGILADVMDVSEECYENRYIIDLGLKNQKNLAVKKILGGYEFNSKSVLFSIAPLINAAVRIGNNEDVLNMFLTDDNKELLRLKKILENCKILQNEEKERLLPSVREQFDKQDDSIVKVAIINSPYGISGLIGNTVLEEYKCPVLILNEVDDLYIGSMRSVGYGNFASLCNETKMAKANGHPEAAGFEIKKELLNDFLEIINDRLASMEKTVSNEAEIDAQIDVSDITRKLEGEIKKINRISGKGFEPINFFISDLTEYSISSWSKGKHLLVNPSEYVSLIEWNTDADFQEMEDHSLLNDSITAVGSIEGGWVGKKYLLKFIMSDYTIGE